MFPNGPANLSTRRSANFPAISDAKFHTFKTADAPTYSPTNTSTICSAIKTSVITTIQTAIALSDTSANVSAVEATSQQAFW